MAAVVDFLVRSPAYEDGAEITGGKISLGVDAWVICSAWKILKEVTYSVLMASTCSFHSRSGMDTVDFLAIS